MTNKKRNGDLQVAPSCIEFLLLCFSYLCFLSCSVALPIVALSLHEVAAKIAAALVSDFWPTVFALLFTPVGHLWVTLFGSIGLLGIFLRHAIRSMSRPLAQIAAIVALLLFAIPVLPDRCPFFDVAINVTRAA